MDDDWGYLHFRKPSGVIIAIMALNQSKWFATRLLKVSGVGNDQKGSGQKGSVEKDRSESPAVISESHTCSEFRPSQPQLVEKDRDHYLGGTWYRVPWMNWVNHSEPIGPHNDG